MKLYPIIVILILLSGCATWFPASVQEIEQGVFTISAIGNSFASREGMKEKINRKADSLCIDKGYEKLAKESVRWTKQRDYASGRTETFQTMSMTITCKQSS